MEPNKNKSILQWNCHGFRPNFEEIKNLTSNFRPYILALQETHFKDSDNVCIRSFDHYFKTCMSEVDGRATGGCSIFVKKGIPHEVLELDTELQAVAVKVSLHKTITVCNVYIPPHFNVAQTDRGHGGRVVTLSPRTSEAGVRSPAQPQVGKLVVACRWSAVYSTEP